MPNTTIWIDDEDKDNVVILSREEDGHVDDIELRSFRKKDEAYRFAVDLETFLRAHKVEVELDFQL